LLNQSNVIYVCNASICRIAAMLMIVKFMSRPTLEILQSKLLILSLLRQESQSV